MDSVAELVKEMRREARLTVRGLADRAGVSVSTVTRVESGRVDPTVGMLHRLAEAAGHDLVVTATPADDRPPRAMVDVATAWHRGSTRGEAGWARLQALLDHLGEHPEQVPVAIAARPGPSGSPVVDAMLSAVARQLADDVCIDRPAWTRSNRSSRAGVRAGDWRRPGAGVPQ